MDRWAYRPNCTYVAYPLEIPANLSEGLDKFVQHDDVQEISFLLAQFHTYITFWVEHWYT
jgi:hypothetical protein